MGRNKDTAIKGTAECGRDNKNFLSEGKPRYMLEGWRCSSSMEEIDREEP